MDICCEIQKLPNLLEHYEEHKECNDDSLLKFIFNDYINFDGLADKHNDDSSHKDLPFQGNHQCNHGGIYYSSIQIIELSNLGYSLTDEICKYSVIFTTRFPDSPFQPPKA